MLSLHSGLLLLALTAATAAREDGYRDLFNGKDLDGWVVEGPKTTKQGEPMWSVEDGNIVCLGKGFGFLRYDRQQFGDFALRVEYRFEAPKSPKQHGNSGLGIRTPVYDPKKSTQTRPSYGAWEVQLLDDAGKKPDAHGTGSLYRYVAPTANVVKPAPEWNTIEVQCVGPVIRVSMNGQQILEADQNKIPNIKDQPAGTPGPKEKALRGYVALQSHSGKVEFRKVQVREIKAAPAAPGKVFQIDPRGSSWAALSTPHLKGPFGVDIDRAGNLYFVEMTGNKLRKVDASGVLSTVAGTGAKGDGGDGGPGLQAQLNGPHSLAVGPNGDVYVADTWNNRIRKVDPKTGVITTVAGTGEKGFSGDGGPAEKAQFGGVYCICFDPKGERLYLADLDNRRIRSIDMASGTVKTVAGNGKRGVPEDGADALEAPLVDPRAVAVDGQGNIWILERGGNALRVVDARGKIRTVVGTGKAGSGGDGGPGLKAELRSPKHLCMDRDGSVLIADTGNHTIRRFQPADGTIVGVAGSGKKGAAGVGGPPERVELNEPHGVYVDRSGALYIADSDNNRILKLER